ncbi:MAG: aminotransferase class V-fold PLP-dependent enzyme, partial [Clostridia bacterium]|nr:aminotransferase class V-fold PLP-dependent enzyme [Clostridia bacterium]
CSVADFFGADGPEQVIFTLNCTHSINCVLKGVIGKTDHIIVSNLEHNAVMRPLTKIGVNYDIAEVSLVSDSITVENFSRLIKPNTKMIFCTGGSNVIGKLLPLKELGALCRQRGILFGVDAAQTAGVIPIDMKKMNIDFLCIAPHKGLYAPMGVGILIARQQIDNTLIEGGTGTGSAELVQGVIMPEDFESGTVNLPGILGVGAGIEFLKLRGVKNIYSHEMDLSEKIYNSFIKNKKILMYAPKPEINKYAPVISFNVEGKKCYEVSEYLNKKGIAVRAGLHCAPIAHRSIGTLNLGTVRVCPSAFTQANEINYFINAVHGIKS